MPRLPVAPPVVAPLLALVASLAPACDETSRVSRAPDGPPRTDADRDMLEGLDGVLDLLEQVRERDFLHPVVAGCYDKDQLREYLTTQMDEMQPPEVTAAQSRAFIAWGYLPEGTDLRELSLQALTHAVGGFYDWKSQHLYCMTTEVGLLSQYVVIHESMHALQDQHEGLEGYALNAEVMADDDRWLARSAVVEGEATFVTNVMLGRHGDELLQVDDVSPGEIAKAALGELAATQSMPGILADSMTFPYIQGERFVTAVFEAGGWEAVDRLYTDPPTSSEQILHPEKYLARRREEPVPIEAPELLPLLGEGWDMVYANTAGEMSYQLLMKHVGDPGDAFRAADGWGGDAYRLYGHDEHGDLLQVVWVGDDEDEAVELQDALVRLLERNAGAGERLHRPEPDAWPVQARLTDDAGHTRELLRREDSVVVWLRGLPAGVDGEALVEASLP